MRLQSAIFTFPDALLDGGALRPGADKVLSILKMESVWLYAVTAGFRAVAVGGAVGEDEWRQMCALADYELPHYEDWLRLE